MTTEEFRLTIVPRRHETRILMTEGPDDVLVARLGPVTSAHHRWAAPMLLEALSLWQGRPLRVVLSAESVVRADDELVSVLLETKTVAQHRRSWGIGQDIEHPSHKKGLLEHRPRAAAGALPPALVALGETGRTYFKLLAAGSRSIHRETLRLTFLVEVFGASATESATREVMQTGHVGAEYVEYVMRHKRGLVPQPAPLRLGNAELDGISLPEPDLAVYDQLFATPMTRDPGEPPPATEESS